MIRAWSFLSAVILLGGCTGAASGVVGLGGGSGASSSGQITVGNFFFQSAHNSTMNPAVDTVKAGATITWTWNETGTGHSVQSTGSPSFVGSSLLNTNGASFSVTFSTAGTYTYDCSQHGLAMTGRVVVQ